MTPAETSSKRYLGVGARFSPGLVDYTIEVLYGTEEKWERRVATPGEIQVMIDALNERGRK